MKTKAFAFSMLALSALIFSGCEDMPAPAVPAIPHELADDSYSSSLVVAGRFKVLSSADTIVEVDPEGIVNVYGVPVSGSNNSIIRPNVKVTGNGTFNVHGCNTVKADEGARLNAYGCYIVKAMSGTTVNAYNCTEVKAATNAAKVEAHGITKVTQVNVPKPPTPATSVPTDQTQAAPEKNQDGQQSK